MKYYAFLLLALFSLHALAEPAWKLEKSTLTYTVKHLLKTTSGTSHEARGKGVCEKSGCSFLVATPIKSFDSGNSNRDAHMLETMKGAAYPIVEVRVDNFSPKKDSVAKTRVSLAGKEKTYEVPVKLRWEGEKKFHLDATIPFRMSDFDLERPSLLTRKIEDEVPVQASMDWALAD